jgi:hypothetical protein
MDLSSKYFDRIRISRPTVEARAETAAAPCQWAGCGRHGGYRAPMGRGREGQYLNFCLEHVREYNRSYNYFSGMSDDDIVAYQRSAQTGHRPTWTVGADRRPDEGFAPNRAWAAAFSDPFGFFAHGAETRRAKAPEGPRRPLRNVERRSFEALDLDGGETGQEIKARYKTLVKQLHPDANGGDRSTEDRLRQIIQAYHYLKAAGFC